MRAVFGLVLVLGLGLAGFAVYMVQGYFEEQEAALARERAAAQAIVPTIEVIAVNRTIEYGEPLTTDDLVVVRYVEDALPEGVYTSAEALFPRGTDVPRTVLRQMSKNEPVLASKVSEPGQMAGITTRLEPGMRAFTISVDVQSGVSGFLRPGDKVDIYWSGVLNLGSHSGQEITRLIAPLGARVLAHDPFLPEAAAAEHGVTLVSLDEVMSAPRAVFIAAAPTHENRGLIGAAQIARMWPGAQLLVISRAHLVDFDALTEAVLAGRIRAAIDVFPSEPLSADHPIRSAAGVILSPHRAAAVDGGRHLIGRMLLDDLAAIREGRPERRLQVATPEKVRLTAGVGDAEQVGAMAEER